jgi:hypothetical protein
LLPSRLGLSPRGRGGAGGGARRARPDGGSSRRAALARAGAIASVIALAVAAVALGIGSKRRPSEGSTPALDVTGRFVYASQGPGNTQRLVVWTPASDSFAEGPRVGEATQIVSADSVLPGWIGVTVRLPDGSLRAEVLRSLDRTVKPTPVATGDIIYWEPGGSSVISVRRAPAAGHHLSVRVLQSMVGTGTTYQRFVDPTLRGDVMSVGAGGKPPSIYFTLLRDGKVSILRVDSGGVRTVLRGFALLDVSPAGDRLIVPGSDLSLGNDIPGARAPQPLPALHSVIGPTFFVPEGQTSLTIPYGSEAGDLVIQRMMAWAPDAASALVAGPLGDRSGIWELGTTPSSRSRPPTYVSPIASTSTTWATYASGDTPVIETGGRIWVFRDGERIALPLPTGAPAPSGPILWTN